MSLANLLEGADAATWYEGASQALDGPLRYKWNDEKPTEYYGAENRRLEKALAQPPMRVGLGTSIAFAEWIWLRLRTVAKDHRLPKLIEASWASLVDWHYFDASSQTEKELAERKKGPVEGPLSIAHRHLFTSVLNAANETGFYSRAVYISNLAEHVVARPEIFTRWRRATIERVQRLYPDDPDDLFGPPIPRQAIIDPGFKLNDAPKLLDAFLSELTPTENPYLTQPAVMKRAGFKGTPYCFK